MGESTAIAWCDHTFNPWWGCTRVSPGCEHCYAEAFAKRTGLGWGPRAARRLFGEKHWSEPVKWNRAAERDGIRRRVFCASMADVFEDRPELEPERVRLWTLIEATPGLDWLLLTKRPENWRRMVPASWLAAPRRNVWALTTAEDQERADQRIPKLLQIPAVVRGVSYEPALGPVDFRQWIPCCKSEACDERAASVSIDWLIVGGESGGGARPCDLAWARSARDQCRAAGVAFFMKQFGARPFLTHSHGDSGSLNEIRCQGADNRIGGFCHHSLSLRDRKGGDPSEWPEDLRVREFPTTQEPTQ